MNIVVILDMQEGRGVSKEKPGSVIQASATSHLDLGSLIFKMARKYSLFMLN
jgi:hypothetical protein